MSNTVVTAGEERQANISPTNVVRGPVHKDDDVDDYDYKIITLHNNIDTVTSVQDIINIKQESR